ncbi:MAG: multicopper oxidase domain-containing protein [Bryobacteraceae bacterium]
MMAIWIRQLAEGIFCACFRAGSLGQWPLTAGITLRIAKAEIELAPGRTVKTTVYNGAVPGPVLRVTKGRPITAKVLNETPIRELVH